MFNNTCCSICLSTNKRYINIYGTDLQSVYEKLAEFKAKAELCFLCYICCSRLRQVANLLNAAKHCDQSPKAVVHLMSQNIENATISYHVVLAKKEPPEFDDVQEKYFEHDNVSIELKRESTDCRSKMNEEQRHAMTSRSGASVNSVKKRPLTAAEISKRYRERLKKNNPEKYMITKEKSRARSAKHYKEKLKALTKEKQSEMRLKWRQKHASKKKSQSKEQVQDIEGALEGEISAVDEADKEQEQDIEGAVEGERSAVAETDKKPGVDTIPTGRKDHLNYLESSQIIMKVAQRNVVNILRRENAKLEEKVLNIERGFKSLKRQMRDLKRKYEEVTEELRHRSAK